MTKHVLVDTNVLIDVLENDPTWADWSIEQLRAQSKLRPLAINAIIYAELSLAFSRIEDLDDAVSQLGLAVLEIHRPALFVASRAFMQVLDARKRQREFGVDDRVNR